MDPFDEASSPRGGTNKDERFESLQVDPKASPTARRDLIKAHFRQRVLAVFYPILTIFAGALAYILLPDAGLLEVSIGPLTVKGALSSCIALSGFVVAFWLIRENFSNK